MTLAGKVLLIVPALDVPITELGLLTISDAPNTSGKAHSGGVFFDQVSEYVSPSSSSKQGRDAVP
jgi:hypothetical protein